MSLEKPTFIPVEKEPPEVNVENVLEGRGLEEISKVGWGKYREALTQTSYADVIDHQIDQIKEIKNKQEPKTESVPEWLVHNLNIKASARAKELSEFLTTEYSRDKQSSFFAYQDRGKKLMVQGREPVMDERDNPIDNHLTRIYLSVLTRNSPEAFKALFDSFVDEGVMDYVRLALNLESYQDDSLDKPFEDNTIIIYVYGQNSDRLTKIAKAITIAKNESPQDLWKLGSEDLAKAKEAIAKDFMIPLDDTTAFVEAKNINSYHAGAYGRIRRSITGELPTTKISLEELSDKFKKWTPEYPGLIEDEPDRRQYMPALVFDK
ncbi:MAG: hypothetical protein Q8Q95_00130 [bacterium]|nr:hypothetical protein [bacterium]